MAEALEEIKIIRKKLGLTQQELAKLAGVSQSLITKIESKKLDPTFSKAKRIFETLHQLQEKHSVKAADLMNTKLISLTTHATLQEAITKMKKHGISQLPVVEHDNGEKCCGLITESTILEALVQKHTLDSTIADIVQEAPPLIDKHATKEVVVNLLRYYPIVLVGEKGKILGFITKADLFGKV